MHGLLQRQVERIFGGIGGVPPGLTAFLAAVEETYDAFEKEQAELERSLEMSSNELLRSNSEMRGIFQALPDLFFRLDGNGIVLEIKGKDADFFMPPHELLGKGLDQIPDANLSLDFLNAVRRVRETNDLVRLDLPVQVGEYCCVYEARLLPLIDQQIIVIVRNVTDRARARMELEKSISLLTATLQSTADGILVVDRDGKVANCNLKFLQMWGIPPEVAASGDDAVLLAHVMDQLVDPQAFLAKVRELYAQHDTEILDSIEFKDSRVFERYSKPQTIGGRYAGRVWSFRDVTAQRRGADELAKQRAFLRQVIDLNPNFIFAKDRQGRFTLVNQAVADAYGTTVENLVGKTDADFIPRAEEVDHFRSDDLEVMDALCEKTILEEQLTDANGDVRWLQTIKRPIISADGRADQVLGVSSDITKHKTLEERLVQSQKMEAIGLLAGGVAHDFNNLLSVISGYAELATKKISDGSSARGDLNKITAASQKAAELTTKLLAFSKRQILQVKTFDVNDVLEDFSKMIARIVGEDVEVRIQKPAAALYVKADGGQLEQVLLNLCTNARQAMPQGGQLLIETRKVKLDEEEAASQPGGRRGEYAVLSVADTGTGMDSRTKERIFEPFFTTKPEGTGLGLATVYGIVQQHGGFIAVKSELGQGTTFSIHLPLRQCESVEGETESADIAMHGTETILIVEDEPAIRELLAMSLTELGYEVIRASGGEEAIPIFEKRGGEIAAVILDVVMPRMGGPAVYQQMKAIAPNVRAIFISGYAPEAAGLTELIRRDNLTFLSKPFSPRLLAVKIRELLDRDLRTAKEAATAR